MSDSKPEEGTQLEQGTSLWIDALRRLRKNYAAMAGAAVVLFMGFIAIGYEVLSASVTHFTLDEQHRRTGPCRRLRGDDPRGSATDDHQVPGLTVG